VTLGGSPSSLGKPHVNRHTQQTDQHWHSLSPSLSPPPSPSLSLEHDHDFAARQLEQLASHRPIPVRTHLHTLMLNTRGGGIKYGILFRFSLFYEHSNHKKFFFPAYYRRSQPRGIRYSYSCGCVRVNQLEQLARHRPVPVRAHLYAWEDEVLRLGRGSSKVSPCPRLV